MVETINRGQIMLIQTKYTANDIITISLMSGQEVLGKFTSEDDTNIVLHEPLVIAFGQQGAAFQTFTVSGDASGDVSFRQDKIVSILKTNNETTEAYKSATSSIVLPKKSGLIV